VLNENSFILHRARGEIRIVPDSEPPIINVAKTSWRIPHPPEPTEQMIEIKVSRRGLESVRWNGTVCDTLQDKELVGADPYQGEFGLYTTVASAQLTSGWLMPTE